MKLLRKNIRSYLYDKPILQIDYIEAHLHRMVFSCNESFNSFKDRIQPTIIQAKTDIFPDYNIQAMKVFLSAGYSISIYSNPNAGFKPQTMISLVITNNNPAKQRLILEDLNSKLELSVSSFEFAFDIYPRHEPAKVFDTLKRSAFYKYAKKLSIEEYEYEAGRNRTFYLGEEWKCYERGNDKDKKESQDGKEGWDRKSIKYIRLEFTAERSFITSYLKIQTLSQLLSDLHILRIHKKLPVFCIAKTKSRNLPKPWEEYSSFFNVYKQKYDIVGRTIIQEKKNNPRFEGFTAELIREMALYDEKFHSEIIPR